MFTLHYPNTQVICEESTKKIAEVVDRFTVEFQKERDVVDALSCIAQLDSQADKVNASRCNGTLKVREGDALETWLMRRIHTIMPY